MNIRNLITEKCYNDFVAWVKDNFKEPNTWTIDGEFSDAWFNHVWYDDVETAVYETIDTDCFYDIEIDRIDSIKGYTVTFSIHDYDINPKFKELHNLNQ